MVIEGMLALTGQHFIIDYNEEQGTLPGFVEGFTTSPATSTATSRSARASCATWRRRTTRYRDAIQRTLVEVRRRPPTACCAPKWCEEGETRAASAPPIEETRAFAMKALERRLKVIGLAPVA